MHEITCLDRYDTNNEMIDISDMSNHSDHQPQTKNSSNHEESDVLEDEYDEESKRFQVKDDLLWIRVNYLDFFRGIGITLSQIPELISYALLAGIKPEMAFISSWIINLLSSVLNGKNNPYMSGLTLSISLILSSLLKNNNVGYAYYTIILSGIFQILFGTFKFDVIFKLISYPVYAAYLTSMGIMLSFLQINYFKQSQTKFELFPTTSNNDWVDKITCMIMIFEILATILLCVFIPQISKQKKIPYNLVAIPIITMFEYGAIRPLGYDTPLVSDLYLIQKTSPTFIFTDISANLPPFTINTFQTILSSSILIFLSSIIDTYLSTLLVNELIITTTNHNNSKTCIVQGSSQITSSIFGGVGGANMIFQTFINVTSGSSSSLSTFGASIALICICSFAFPIINIIPIACITGVMLYAAYHLIQWKIFKWMLSSILPERMRIALHLPICKLRKIELCTLVLVVLLSFVFGLEFGVIAGVILSLIDFALQAGKRLEIKHEVELDTSTTQNSIYHISGPIYFGSCNELLNEFSIYNMNHNSPNGIILSLEGAEVFDYTGLYTLYRISNDLGKKLGKTVAFADVSAGTKKLMEETASLWENMYFLEYKDLENTTLVAGDDDNDQK